MIHKTYIINLSRRTDKRMHMEHEFKKLANQGTNLNYSFFDAIDGCNKEITSKYKFNIPNWADPSTGKALTEGEVGCGLSHYLVWKDIVDICIKDTETTAKKPTAKKTTVKNTEITDTYTKTKQKNFLILEDDVIFADDFMYKFQSYMNELGDLPYDLIYMHRKILDPNGETKLTEHITANIKKSYWACAYILTYTGAQKCLNARYLENIIPVDEFLPIMYGSHVNGFEKLYNRDDNLLTAYAITPSLFKLTWNAFHESETYHTGSFTSGEIHGKGREPNDTMGLLSTGDHADFLTVYIYDGKECHHESLNRFKEYSDIYGIPYTIINIDTAIVIPTSTNIDIDIDIDIDIAIDIDINIDIKVLNKTVQTVKSITNKNILLSIIASPNAIPMAPSSEIKRKYHNLTGFDNNKIIVSTDGKGICTYITALDHYINNKNDFITNISN